MSIYSDKLTQVQVVTNCQYFAAPTYLVQYKQVHQLRTLITYSVCCDKHGNGSRTVYLTEL